MTVIEGRLRHWSHYAGILGAVVLVIILMSLLKPLYIFNINIVPYIFPTKA